MKPAGIHVQATLPRPSKSLNPAGSRARDRLLRRLRAFEKERPWWGRRAFWEILLTALTLSFLLLGRLIRWPGPLAWLATACYVLAYVTGGYFGVGDAWQTLKDRKLDVNLLMFLAALGAASVNEAPEGAILLFLFSLSNTLQDFALLRSRRAIRSLMALRPDRATRLREGRAETVRVELLQVGDTVLVRPGERISADGIVRRGESYVDESTVTGESFPVAKRAGERAYAGTLNENGSLEIEVSEPAEQTLLSHILQLVEYAQEQKARTQRWLEKFEQRYSIAVLAGVALLAVMAPVLAGTPFPMAFYRAMTLLVVASPCALIISTPATILSAVANAARHGVLFKGGEPLERTAEVKAMAFDKTGTLTEGKLHVTDSEPFGADETDLWQTLLDVESNSEHPLARALVNAAQARGLTPQPVENFQAVPGKGVRARRRGKEVLIGNPRLFADQLAEPMPPALREGLARLQGEGKTAMCIYEHRRWLGIVAVADTLRRSARPALEELKHMGIHPLVMLSGDGARIAQGIGGQLGVDRVYAELLPQEKLHILQKLAAEFGPVAMVGDGVNDAPALAAGAVGIAMGAGTDVALETADVALVGDQLNKLPYAVALSKQAMRVIKQNLTVAVGVIGIMVILTLTLDVRMPLGVVAHEGSTVAVVLNGLRLLNFQPGPGRKQAHA
jgi:Cd2+/Zn2+-exporting ATPase